jgi:hypothetical protein
MAPSWDLVALLVVVIFLLIVLLWWRSGSASRASRGRVRRAIGGEQRAEELLARAGYGIEARQERAVWWMTVDGEEVEVEVRADFIVTARGRRFVAEVKTGGTAPDPTHPATRRQLLEYAHAFALGDVLLVDAEAGRIHVVGFRP